MKIKVTVPVHTTASVYIEVPDNIDNPAYVAREFVLAACEAGQGLPFVLADWRPDTSHSWQLDTEPPWHAKRAPELEPAPEPAESLEPI